MIATDDFPTWQEVGERIAAARAASGLSLAEAAEKADLNEWSATSGEEDLRRQESGEPVLAAYELHVLAGLFGTTLKALIYGEVTT